MKRESPQRGKKWGGERDTQRGTKTETDTNRDTQRTGRDTDRETERVRETYGDDRAVARARHPTPEMEQTDRQTVWSSTK